MSNEALYAEQIEELASFILKHCPEEIGAGNPRDGESAVEIAIRIIRKHKGIKD